MSKRKSEPLPGDNTASPFFWRDVSPILFITLIGVALYLQAGFWVAQWEDRQTRNSFEQFAEQRIYAITDRIDRNLSALIKMATFLEIQPDASYQEYSAIARSLRKPNDGFQTINWIPRVTENEKRLFMANARQLFPDFVIFSQDGQGRKVILEDREVYYPIYYPYPLEGNQAVIGYDPIQLPLRNQALHHAIDTAGMGVSEALKILQDKARGRSILVFYPVYGQAGSGSTIIERRNNLIGLVEGVYTMEQLVRASFRQLSPVGIDILIEDISAPEGNQFLFFYDSKQENQQLHQNEEGLRARLNDGLTLSENIAVGGRNWRITAHATSADFIVQIGPVRKILIATIIFSFCLSVYMAVLLIRNKRSFRQLAVQSEQLNRSNRALEKSQRRFDLAMRGSNDGLWDLNVTTEELYVSPRLLEMLGEASVEAVGDYQNWLQRTHPNDQDALTSAIEAQKNSETNKFFSERRIRHADGHYFWVIERGLITRDSKGIPKRMVGTVTDISQRKAIEQEFYEEKELLEVTFRSIHDGIIVCNPQGVVTFLNPMAESITAHESTDAIGHDISRLFKNQREDDALRCQALVQQCLTEQKVISVDAPIYISNRAGKEIAIQQTVSPLTNPQGEPMGCVMVISDVTMREQLQQELSHQAAHDPLTGLVNRREFERRLRQVIEQCVFPEEHHVLCYMDLDQFKVVNDTCGHVAGDELLRLLSRILKKQVRTSDVLARIGGDEFGILLMHCPMDRAKQVGDSLLESIREFHFVWDGKPFSVGASIGMVPINYHTSGLSAALSQADAACYTAKEKGRNRYHLYQPDDDSVYHHEMMQWVTVIKQSLQHDRFRLRAQLIAPLKSESEHEHHEILISMLDEDGNTIPPGAFIPAAERYNIMPDIDRWVIRNLFKRLSEDKDLGDTSKHWAINLSGNSLTDERFLDFVLEQLDYYQVDPTNFIFEVTETAAIANLNVAIDFIKVLRDRGCAFALDDFGAGMSSFAYLKSLPVNYLKIDGHFVRDIVDDPIDRAMVKAINEVGQVLKMKTIAEFVEDGDILEELRKIGVDFAQGYHLGKPFFL